MIGGSFLQFRIDSQYGIGEFNLAKGIKIQLLFGVTIKKERKESETNRIDCFNA
jgi:hypothetical protein